MLHLAPGAGLPGTAGIAIAAGSAGLAAAGIEGLPGSQVSRQELVCAVG